MPADTVAAPEPAPRALGAPPRVKVDVDADDRALTAALRFGFGFGVRFGGLLGVLGFDITNAAERYTPGPPRASHRLRSRHSPADRQLTSVFNAPT